MSQQNKPSIDQTYNFAYLDEQTKRMIRRAILKAIATPGYQVPFCEPRDADALWLGYGRYSGYRVSDRAR